MTNSVEDLVQEAVDQMTDELKELQELMQGKIDDLKQEIEELKANQKKISFSSEVHHEIEDGVIKFSIYKKGVIVKGDTKGYKDILKTKGAASWNGGLKGWIMSIPKAQLLIPKMVSKFGDKILIESDELKPEIDDFEI